MSSIMQFDFRLFGPRKGQTMVLNGHQFIDGVCTLVQSSENMGTCARVFSFYNCYARGTPEYDTAVATEEAEHGTGKVPEETLEGIDTTVSANTGPDGPGPAETGSSLDSSGSDHAEGTNGPSSDSSRDGHEHPRVPIFPEDADYRAEEPSSSVNADLVTAVRKLDPDVESHWVLTGAHKGKPKLQAIEDAYGKAGLTRQDIEAVLPGYNRDAAIGIALAG